MSRHTPGPWGFGRTGDEQRMILGNAGKGRYVCSVQIHQMPRSMGLCDEPEREANASLIAAAPDLLTACREAQQALRRYTIHSGSLADARARADALDLLNAAILKAKGVQP